MLVSVFSFSPIVSGPACVALFVLSIVILSEIAEVKRQLRKLADDTVGGRVTPGVASVVSQVWGRG